MTVQAAELRKLIARVDPPLSRMLALSFADPGRRSALWRFGGAEGG